MVSPQPEKRVLQAPKAPFFGSLPPVYAGLARGFTFAIGLGIVEAIIHFTQTVDTTGLPPALAILFPALTIVFTGIAGLIDHKDAK